MFHPKHVSRPRSSRLLRHRVFSLSLSLLQPLDQNANFPVDIKLITFLLLLLFLRHFFLPPSFPYIHHGYGVLCYCASCCLVYVIITTTATKKPQMGCLHSWSNETIISFLSFFFSENIIKEEEGWIKKKKTFSPREMICVRPQSCGATLTASYYHHQPLYITLCKRRPHLNISSADNSTHSRSHKGEDEIEGSCERSIPIWLRVWLAAHWTESGRHDDICHITNDVRMRAVRVEFWWKKKTGEEPPPGDAPSTHPNPWWPEQMRMDVSRN